jgi:hypothetical protein
MVGWKFDLENNCAFRTHKRRKQLLLEKSTLLTLAVFLFPWEFFTIINPNYHFEVTYNSKEKFQFTFGLTFNNLFLLSAVVRGDEPDDERDVQLQTVQLSQERTRQVLQPFLSRNHLQFGRILSLCPTRRFARRTQCPPRNAVLDIIQF